jgi:hypothetical protein
LVTRPCDVSTVVHDDIPLATVINPARASGNAKPATRNSVRHLPAGASMCSGSKN